MTSCKMSTFGHLLYEDVRYRLHTQVADSNTLVLPKPKKPAFKAGQKFIPEVKWLG